MTENYLPNTKWLKEFRKNLLDWYAKNSRQLAWRGTRDPYQIWVSEIMLQQTTAAAVDGYFRRFIERFPNVQVLANDDVTEVLRYWEGLGYYRRATLLHRAAQVIVSEHNGLFPNTLDTVLALPGIGRYTAGAILSIAQDQRLPILEANTIRLHARLLAYPDDPAKSEGNKLLWQMAEIVLPEKKSQTTDRQIGLFNQALMDLGSLVCLPKEPKCRECPVVKLCQTAQAGLQHAIPKLNKQKNFEERIEAALVVEKNGKYLMVRYPEGVRWSGLWDFPRSVVAFDQPLDGNPNFLKRIKDICGYRLDILEQIASIRHVVTRFNITLYVHYARLNGSLSSAEYETCWVTKKELSKLPLNTTGRKIAKLL
ncbi:MAG: A/G-specific adenine glycosylase [Planctomycetaceae bacterium]|nr:A/G-specific adenine glycosylase [Planctomycetaceae bacterium]